MKPPLLVRGGHSTSLSLRDLAPVITLCQTTASRTWLSPAELGCCSKAPGSGSGRFSSAQPGSHPPNPSACGPRSYQYQHWLQNVPTSGCQSPLAFLLVICVIVLEDGVPSSLSWQVCRVCHAVKWHLSNCPLRIGNHTRMFIGSIYKVGAHRS